jgi:hypothetical protein
MLPGVKSFDVKRLHAMGQVSEECNNNDLIIERYKCKLKCLVRTTIIDKEEDPFVKIKANT